MILRYKGIITYYLYMGYQMSREQLIRKKPYLLSIGYSVIIQPINCFREITSINVDEGIGADNKTIHKKSIVKLSQARRTFSNVYSPWKSLLFWPNRFCLTRNYSIFFDNADIFYLIGHVNRYNRPYDPDLNLHWIVATDTSRVIVREMFKWKATKRHNYQTDWNLNMRLLDKVPRRVCNVRRVCEKN